MEQLSYTAGGLMIAVAVIIDFVLDPAIDLLTFGIGGFLVDLLAVLIFWPWMKHHDMDLFGANAAGSLLTVFVEATPILNLVAPGWTLRVAILVTREWRR